MAETDGQGAVAQLGERLICIQEVAGSIPTSSTSYKKGFSYGPAYPRFGRSTGVLLVRACSSVG
jgi:hypothetical protein